MFNLHRHTVLFKHVSEERAPTRMSLKLVLARHGEGGVGVERLELSNVMHVYSDVGGNRRRRPLCVRPDVSVRVTPTRRSGSRDRDVEDTVADAHPNDDGEEELDLVAHHDEHGNVGEEELEREEECLEATRCDGAVAEVPRVEELLAAQPREHLDEKAEEAGADDASGKGAAGGEDPRREEERDARPARPLEAFHVHGRSTAGAKVGCCGGGGGVVVRSCHGSAHVAGHTVDGGAATHTFHRWQ